LRIFSWNINGLRSTLNKGWDAWRDDELSIICLQETRMQADLLTDHLFYPKLSYWNPAKQNGYSGVVTIVDQGLKPITVTNGIGDMALDREGRVIITEFSSMIVVNTYAPHSHRKLLRLPDKERFIVYFLKKIRSLRNLKKPVIITGDFNVAHQDLDLFHYKSNRKNAGFLPQERQFFSDLLALGFIDAFRFLYPERREYSWWAATDKLRQRDIGWRIDYILIDETLKDRIKDCRYLKYQEGSDHCPVTVDLDIW
jgi:exodeoxyribonuclease III